MQHSTIPHILSLAHRGHIQGTAVSDGQKPLCYFYGGVRYALPPSERWRKAVPLPPGFTYETTNTSQTGAKICPQPGFLEVPDESNWDEDCFQCNVWVPAGEPPAAGWPVFVFLHGGWLQFGTPNRYSVAALLGETEFKCVVVMPAYRLNVFGFLSANESNEEEKGEEEIVSNVGFWDQRMALEWVRDNISLFGGNSDNVTLSGYSAGAYSVFYQLAYELHLPDENQSIIQQAALFSNGPGLPLKTIDDAQVQFNQLLIALNISSHLAWSDKVRLLRSASYSSLLAAISNIELHQFRPIVDGYFVSSELSSKLNSGEFGRILARRNVRVLLSECQDEHHLYSLWYPPTENSLPALKRRLLADYPPTIAATLINLYYPSGDLPPHLANWDHAAFGHIYADVQVHKTQRGLIYSLAQGGASHLVHRYRIEYRLQSADNKYPREWGVTHGTDLGLWFWGNGDYITEPEKDIVKEAVITPLVALVQGSKPVKGTNGVREVRRLKANGEVGVWQDELWDDALVVWKACI